MKFRFLISVIALCVSFTASAQLKVANTGKITLGSNVFGDKALVSAGESSSYVYPVGYSFGLIGRNTLGDYCIGVKGTTSASSMAYSIGVQGVATGGRDGYLFGVIGAINDTNKKGAGIYGTTYSSQIGKSLPGRYAGYFNGEVYVNGKINVEQLVYTSDIRLKENIESLSNIGTLDNILKMNVVKYNYKDFTQEDSEADSVAMIPSKRSKETHFGLLAQELQELYPELVHQGQDGYLGINYVEIIPLLIQSIQELKEELNTLRENDIIRKAESTASLLASDTNKQSFLYHTSVHLNPLTIL